MRMSRQLGVGLPILRLFLVQTLMWHLPACSARDPWFDPGRYHLRCKRQKGVAVSWQVLGQGAVHGAFAGYTGFTVGLVNTHYVYAAAAFLFTVSSAV